MRAARVASSRSASTPMRNDVYAHAPRLPESEAIDPRSLLRVGEGPIDLEIGPGRGWFLVERAEAFPERGIIGLEVRRKWATIVDERLRKRGYGERARCFAEDARSALPRLRSSSIALAFVHFPDPWWKKRHAKRLVVTDALVAELARVIAPGGELFIQTDVEHRADAYEATLARAPAFVPWETRARVGDHPYVARSPRERRAIADGLPVQRLRYRRL